MSVKINIQLRFFASLREQFGSHEALTLAPGTTVGQLRDLLMARSDAHAHALGRTRALRCAVNQLMCGEDTVLQEGAEVAFFPPVTGG